GVRGGGGRRLGRAGARGRRDVRARVAGAGREGSGIRVLVVDDEPQILRALQMKLSSEGYDVDTAGTAASALAAAAARVPEAVILDVLLPDGRGTDVCRELREWSSAPLLMLSAGGDQAPKTAP